MSRGRGRREFRDASGRRRRRDLEDASVERQRARGQELVFAVRRQGRRRPGCGRTGRRGCMGRSGRRTGTYLRCSGDMLSTASSKCPLGLGGPLVPLAARMLGGRFLLWRELPRGKSFVMMNEKGEERVSGGGEIPGRLCLLRQAPAGALGAVFQHYAQISEALADGIGQGELFGVAEVGAGLQEQLDERGDVRLRL